MYAASPTQNQSTDDLLSLFATGQRARPNIELDQAIFSQHVARHHSLNSLKQSCLHAGDLFLACACVVKIPHAIKTFESEYLARVQHYVRRIDTSHAFADDVRQTLTARLLVGPPPRLEQYSGRGPLEHWVRVSALHSAYSVCRTRTSKAQRIGAEWEAQKVIGACDPELRLIRKQYREPFCAAFRAALATLSTRDRQAMRLHIIDGVNLDRIGALHGVNRSTVYRWIADARQQLFSVIRAELRGRLPSDTSELNSILAALGSQLELSIGQLWHLHGG